MKIQNKKVLVTGAAGFIGSNLVEDLLKNGNEVIGLDNLSTGFLSNLEEFQNQPNFSFIEGDIRDLSTCIKACEGVDIVLHQAALGSVPRSIADPITTNSVNIDGFLNMLIAARDTKVRRFVYASSSSVYGDSAELPKVEENIGNPLSPYATTKVVNELYANVFYNLYGLEVIGLRYFNVFGPKQSPHGEYAAVIPKFIDTMLKGISPTINGDGSNSRDFTFVENIVQMNNLAATTENKNCLGQVFNTAVGTTLTLNGLVEILNNVISSQLESYKRVKVQYGPEREGDIPHSWASVDKAKDFLSYSPNIDFEECIKRTLIWHF
jgi:UDP-N-acetylglucosamine 4-epimerase